MDRFYEMGKYAALAKLGQGGLLRQLASAAKGAYKGLSPEAAQAVQRMGAGAGLGAAGGAAADDFSLRGMLGGAALGAGAGAGYHKLRNLIRQALIRKEIGRPLAAEGKQLDLFGRAPKKTPPTESLYEEAQKVRASAFPRNRPA